MQKSAFGVIVVVAMIATFLATRQKQGGLFPGDAPVAGVKQIDFPVPPAAVDDGIAVYFSPQGGCEAAVVDEIEAARKTIDVQAYSFTSKPIAAALGAAEDRGVRVRAVLDEKATAENSIAATYILDHGVATYTDGDHPIAHNKVMIIDGQTVLTGSFNFTKQAERENAENLVIITGRAALAAAYEANFEHHLGHSQAYEGASSGGRSEYR